LEKRKTNSHANWSEYSDFWPQIFRDFRQMRGGFGKAQNQFACELDRMFGIWAAKSSRISNRCVGVLETTKTNSHANWFGCGGGPCLRAQLGAARAGLPAPGTAACQP
jgi:hypothetical protein